MHPLGTQLSNFSDFESDLRAALSDGHVIGFLLDSGRSDLRKSGLILHPDAVMPLHELLGEKATIFYPDPRRFEGRDYQDAVREFGQKLMGSENVPYRITPPGLLLMTHREGVFEKTKLLSLDPGSICLWHSQVYTFVEEYLGNQLPSPQQEQWLKSMVKTHAGAIGMESVKTCVGIFLSKLMPL
jgi:hypothetical protein